jgi:hypothetical protein
LALNMWNELVANYLCLSMSTNIFSIISSSLEDELELFVVELQLFPIELHPWIENKTMISKWKNPSTSEQWKRKSKWEMLLLM